MIDGVTYPILETIGMPRNCSWTEILEYWAYTIAAVQMMDLF